MERDPVLERMHDELGLSHHKTRRIFHAIASMLFVPLPASLRARIVERVPLLRPDLEGVAPLPGPAAAPPLRALVGAVAEATHQPTGPALEQTQVACRLLGERFDEELHLHLRRELAADVAELFARVPPADAAEPVPHPRERYQGIASGRSGGARPLAEAAPGAQSGSLAAAAEPHGDTKLSSSPGVSIEREGKTLATGHPGSRRPVSEGEE